MGKITIHFWKYLICNNDHIFMQKNSRHKKCATCGSTRTREATPEDHQKQKEQKK